MRQSEISDVSELLREAYQWLGKREGLSSSQLKFLTTERGSVASIQRESLEQQYIVTVDGDHLTGVVSVAGDLITKLYVRPSMFGRGIGRKLYEAAEAIIAAGGHTHVRLGAFGSAVPFYEHMGLHVSGQKRPGGPMAGLVFTLMEKSLEAN
jgi:ribosomal protein S18 acetylase RimI-like enzyme